MSVVPRALPQWATAVLGSPVHAGAVGQYTSQLTLLTQESDGKAIEGMQNSSRVIEGRGIFLGLYREEQVFPGS